jgi:hypothetical protein
MFKYRNRVAKLSGLAVLALFAVGITQADALLMWDGITPAPNDSTTWNGLGADGATIPNTFSATSAGGVSVSGSFAGTGGLVAIECPASPSCSWTGSSPFTAGEHLIWAFNNSTSVGTGPLTLGFGAPVLAGGLDIQADAAGAFTAQVEAFNGATLLGTESLASDTAGDPIFIGAKDIVADITSLGFVLTACTGTGCDLNDFAVGTLLSVNPTVAVPAPLIGFGLPVFLAVGGLLFGAKLLERSRRGAGLFDVA